MKLRLLPSLSLLVLPLAARGAQPADDFFHSGAQFYLSNNVPGAIEQVDKGLKLYPDDVKLKKLEELLKKQNQQQSQSQQSQAQQSQSQNSTNQQPSQSQQQPPDRQKQDQPPQQPQNSKPQEPSKSEPDSNSQPQETPGKMTPQQAQKLLDDQKGDEHMLQPQPDGKQTQSGRKIKDW